MSATFTICRSPESASYSLPSLKPSLEMMSRNLPQVWTITVEDWLICIQLTRTDTMLWSSRNSLHFASTNDQCHVTPLKNKFCSNGISCVITPTSEPLSCNESINEETAKRLSKIDPISGSTKESKRINTVKRETKQCSGCISLYNGMCRKSL